MTHMKPEKPDTDLPPHDPVAELTYLASCVQSQDASAMLSEDLFYTITGKSICSAMLWLMKENKPLLESEILRRVPLDTFIKLNEALNEGLSPTMWRYWHDHLDELRGAREAAKIEVELAEARKTIASGGTADIQAIAGRLAAIESRSAVTSFDMRSAIAGVISELETIALNPESAYGVKTRLAPLDKMLLGLHNGRLYTVAARPGNGKSSLLIQIASEASMASVPTLLFSLEMPANEIVKRSLSIVSGVSARVFETTEATARDFSSYTAAQLRISDIPLTVDDSSSTLKQIIERGNESVRKGKARLVVVDYLQRIRIPGYKENRTALIGEISGALKDSAMRWKVPVLCAAQLSRAHESEGRTPGLADLRDSGAIEQDSDCVLILSSKVDDPDTVNCLIAKNRQGPSGSVKLRFNRQCTRFEESHEQ